MLRWVVTVILAGVMFGPGLFELYNKLQAEDDQNEEGGDEEGTLNWITGFLVEYKLHFLVVILIGLALFLVWQWTALQEDQDYQEDLQIRTKALKVVENFDNGESINNVEGVDFSEYSRDNRFGPVIPPYDESYPPWAKDVEIEPGDTVHIQASLVGGSWKKNCNYPEYTPTAKISFHTPTGTHHGGGPYIAFFNDGKLEVEIDTQYGRRLDFHVGCPTKKRWLKLDYEILEFFISGNKKT